MSLKRRELYLLSLVGFFLYLNFNPENEPLKNKKKSKTLSSIVNVVLKLLKNTRKHLTERSLGRCIRFVLGVASS
jgi:hypothetical protein